MAEHSDASMDMDAHRGTYSDFLHLTIITIAFCISIVIMLAIGNAGSWGLAGLGVFLAIVGAVVGLMMKGSPWPIVGGTIIVLALKLLIG
jgi:hypothetical protein